MNYSLFLGRRLALASGGRKNSPAIKVSITAVALSIAVMLASVAIVIGFKREIREKVIGFNSHITLYGIPTEDENNIIRLTPTLKTVLESKPYIDELSLEASIPGILKTDTDFKGIYLRSLGSQSVPAFLRSNLVEGNVPDFKSGTHDDKIVISQTAANQLNLKTGDKINVYFITDDIKVQRLTVAGIYNSHFDNYDQVMAYGSLALIQKLAGLKQSEGTSIQIHTTDFSKVDQMTDDLNRTLAEALASGLLYKPYRIDNALHQGENYFNWLQLLDTNVAVILVLMTIVAVATLISGMLILILDKKRFIGIARALGASVKGVRRVFIYLAIKVAIYGMIIGNAIMLAFLYCQDIYHFLPLDADAYYIDFVPVEINWWYVLLLNAGCLLVIYLSLVIPSRFVAKISPTDAMRANDQ